MHREERVIVTFMRFDEAEFLTSSQQSSSTAEYPVRHADGLCGIFYYGVQPGPSFSIIFFPTFSLVNEHNFAMTAMPRFATYALPVWGCNKFNLNNHLFPTSHNLQITARTQLAFYVGNPCRMFTPPTVRLLHHRLLYSSFPSCRPQRISRSRT